METMTGTPSVKKGDENPVNETDMRVGLHKRSPKELVDQIMLWNKESYDACGDKRKMRTQCHKMYDNDQWEQATMRTMRAQKRPALTFNMLLSIIAAVEGQEQNNRQEMKFYGRSQDDDKLAEEWTRLLKWVMQNNEGDFELSRLFKEMLISGEGWIVPHFDTLDDVDGRILLEWVDNDEIFDDPLSTHPVGLDARYRQRVKMLTEDEGCALFGPQFKTMVRQSAMRNEVSETDGKGFPDIYSTPDGAKKGMKIYDKDDKTWAVVQCWWWEIEDGWVVENAETGLLDEYTEEQYLDVKSQREAEQQAVLAQVTAGTAQIAQPGQVPMADELGVPLLPVVEMPPPLKAEKRPIKRFFEAFTVYDQLLALEPQREKMKMFPAVPLRGIRRKTKNDWVGIVEPIIDAQRQHNVEQSIIVQLMQLMPKNSWMAPKGAYHNRQEWETGVAQPGKMLEYNSRRGKPEPIKQPDMPRHLIEMAQTRIFTMREISGVNVELTGQRQGSDAGVVMEQRAKAAQTVLAPLFENFRRTKKVLGMVLLAFMQAHISPGRRMRILGSDGAESITVTEDMLIGKYDLVVDETDATVNDRVATLNLMQTTLPQMMKAGVPIPPSLVDMLPMDTKIRDEWKRMAAWQLALSGGMPPPGWQPGMPVPTAGGGAAPTAEEPIQ